MTVITLGRSLGSTITYRDHILTRDADGSVFVRSSAYGAQSVKFDTVREAIAHVDALHA